MSLVSKKSKLMDWECTDAETQYITHGIHRYSGKFIPQIASNAIELLTKQNDFVLDVYAGSGTTLLESALLSRKSIGVDLNPLAVLISKVKTTPINPKLLYQWYEGFCDLLQRDLTAGYQQTLLLGSSCSDTTREIDVASDPRINNEWYQKWFQEHALKELISIDLRIHQIKDDNIRLLALLTLSDVLRKSSNAHSSYPNVMFDKNKKDVGPVLPKYLKRLKENVDSVADLYDKFSKRYQPKLIETNNTKLPIATNSIDAIITHPPYIGSVPYAEYGVLSLTWLNACPKSLDSSLTGGQRQRKNVVERFNDDYSKMFKEAHRVLKRNKYLFVLVGNPTVKGNVIDLADTSIKFAEEAKFVLDTHLTRKGINRRANKMGEESILFFRKK